MADSVTEALAFLSKTKSNEGLSVFDHLSQVLMKVIFEGFV